MLNKEKNSFSILFAAVVCAVAAGLLSFASTQLRPLQEANAKLDKQKNILIVLKVGRDGERYGTEHVKAFYADTADQATVQKLYEAYVRPGVVDLATGVVVEGADPYNVIASLQLPGGKLEQPLRKNDTCDFHCAGSSECRRNHQRRDVLPYCRRYKVRSA